MSRNRRRGRRRREETLILFSSSTSERATAFPGAQRIEGICRLRELSSQHFARSLGLSL